MLHQLRIKYWTNFEISNIFKFLLRIIYGCFCVITLVFLVYWKLNWSINIFFKPYIVYVLKKLSTLESVVLLSSLWSVLLCSYLTLKTKKNGKFLIFFIYCTITGSLILITNCTSVFFFFIIYELFLFTSTFLVWFSSQNKRAYKTTIYFLLWTQLGSFFLFIVVVLLIQQYGFNRFLDVFFVKNLTNHIKYLALVVFIAFGIKTPVWPFHFWLTKTHVEANTGFSIFLSGILVKISLFGLYKFYFFLTNQKYFFTYIAVIGLLDAATKVFFQKDLKKIVAFSTIFEMNQLVLLFFLCSLTSLSVINYFVLFHTFISAAFFLITDVFYNQYKTRSIHLIKGASEINYIFSILVTVCVLFFIGLPLTPKFNIEVYFFSKLLDLHFGVLAFIVSVFFVFYFVFVKIFFSLFFGFSKKKILFFSIKKDLIFTISNILLSNILLILV